MIILTGSCSSSSKLMESGNLDAAIDKAISSYRSAKKPAKRDEQVTIVENAYREAMNRDRLLVEQLKSSGDPAHWPRISNIYDGMQRRQDKLAAAMPLTYSNGSPANIDIWNMQAVRGEARENAAAYYYEMAIPLVNSSRKADIRQGFKYLQETARYVSHYKDVQQLLVSSSVRGSNFVYVFAEVGGNFPFIYPAGFTEGFFSKDIRVRSEWLQYDRQQENNRSYDYVVRVIITELERTPETVRERIREESKDIEDGWKYVLDPNGNVKKDSLGNDIKVPNVVRVTAQVLETVQHKASRLTAVVEIIHVQSGKIMDGSTLYGEAVFNNIAYNYRGDKRALSSDSRQKMGNIPLPFPSDDEMIFLAREKLRESAYRFIEDREKLFLQ